MTVPLYGHQENPIHCNMFKYPINYNLSAGNQVGDKDNNLELL